MVCMIQSCKIVTYHYVRPIKKSKFPNFKGLELDHFSKQITYFRKNYNFITAKQLINSIYYAESLPPNPLLLTFDDGLKEHYQHVFPILKKLNIQGLFFVSGLPIKSKTILDVHKIHFILAKCSNETKLVDDIFYLINGYSKEYKLKRPEIYFTELATANKFDTKEVIFIKRVLQKSLPTEIRTKIVDHLFRKYVKLDENKISEQFYLSIEDMKEMREEGMYLGSHGFTHRWLTHLNKKELDIEIKNSRRFFTKINGKKQDMLICYPYGDYNAIVISKLKKNGFKGGFTIKTGNAILKRTQAFELKRYDTNDFKI